MKRSGKQAGGQCKPEMVVQANKQQMYSEELAVQVSRQEM
jgi:hypothetical protein